MKSQQLIIFVAILSTIVIMVESAPGAPIVLVPGLLGSQIEARWNKTTVPNLLCSKTENWTRIWLSIVEILPGAFECFSDTLMIKFHNDTGKYTDNDGVETRVPGFGMTETVEYLDPSTKFYSATKVFHDMVEHFVDKGYTRGVDIVGAPYDWRVSPVQHLDTGFYANLKSLIEQTYLKNNNQKVVLVVHSMGAINTLYFLNKYVDQTWKDTHIGVFVTIAGVWRGAAKSAKAFISGDNEGIVIDKDIWDRSGQRSSPGNAWLLPYPSDTWTKDDILVVTDKRTYSPFDYEALFQDMGYPRGYDMFLETKDLTGPMIPPNVTVHCIYGGNVSTPLQFHYGPGQFPDTSPKVISGDGDGTVNINSLISCERWKGNQYFPVTAQQITGVDHVSMIKDQRVIQAVDQIVFSSH